MNDSGIVTLVLGGARSGKSEVAERLVSRRTSEIQTEPVITYVATGGLVTGDDDDDGWAARIAAHRARRPAGLATVELEAAAKLSQALLDTPGAILVDSLGTWMVGLPGFGQEAAGEVEALIEALAVRRHDGRPTVLVSEEVGLGVHPPTEIGMQFRDALGTLNKAVAEVADEVLLVVAGRVLPLGRP